MLVLFAKDLPEGNWKSALLLTAPALSVTLGALWLFLRVEIANYVQWLKVKSLAKSMQLTLTEALKSTTTSDEHKRVLRTQLEEVGLLLTAQQMKRIKAVAIVTADDVLRIEHEVSDERRL